MKIILLTDVKKVGPRGTLQSVADGYANNVLIPKKLAIPATPANLKRFEAEKGKAAEEAARSDASAREAFAKLEGKTVTLRVRANESGGLFQAVHEKDIIEAIQKEFGVLIPEKGITLAEPLKKTGTYEVLVFFGGARASVNVSLEAQWLLFRL